MLGLRSATKLSTSGQQIFVRNIISVKRRSNKNSGLEFGKKINYKDLKKVEPIQPKTYENTEKELSNKEKLNNLQSYEPKTENFYYVQDFSKLGILYKPSKDIEDWAFFEKTDEYGNEYYSGDGLKLSNKFKIELGKSSNGHSVPFPRISGNSAPLVSVPSPYGQNYKRAMLNNREKLNVLDLSTLTSIEHFIKTQVANDIVGSYSIHTTTPGAIQSSGIDFVNLYESNQNRKYISDYFKKISKVFYLMSVAPKPQLSIIDGLTVGAGLGFTANSGFRVGSENSIVTISDCALGFFPNAGNVRLLNRLPDGIGLYLALTGRRIRGTELHEAGITDFFVLTEDIQGFDRNLSHCFPKNHNRLFESIVLSTTEPRSYLNGKKTHLTTHQDAIKRCFDNKTTIEEVLQALENETEFAEWAERCIRNIRRSSPISIKLTMRLFNETPTDGKGKDYYERDYNISMALTRDHSDLWEGIQSLLIQNREPMWSYKRVEDVPDSLIDEIINYKPEEKELQMKLVDLKSTFTLFENILLEYTNANQILLTEEEHQNFRNFETPSFPDKFEEILEIYDKGARSEAFYENKVLYEFLQEVEEGDF
ncbi:hypothetical protein DICPUDRAFT_38120 [Dictyostelium purpureum]|uniref:Enoyl-CoA hydratase/isomerase domain-containing protein n=1 Tax=Dictyostelium purpureum TaxID=5786 RepID=F0ZTV2_DICPU|nr:uncharacterized protein DICPUDRAFT_38120 [Dictyostelium purpureum]EGC32625.1 hypothetical protein DICPUDRAFT_38120 [Dictyostelium purpureum]|eukprot:XP_003290840.1 hypothetical protein DICPUDRAFT_38120 [Dictyostelium purpureum]